MTALEKQMAEALRLARKFMSIGGAIADEYRQIDVALAQFDAQAAEQAAGGGEAIKAAANSLRTLFGCAASTLSNAQWEAAAYTVLRNARAALSTRPELSDADLKGIGTIYSRSVLSGNGPDYAGMRAVIAAALAAARGEKR